MAIASSDVASYPRPANEARAASRMRSAVEEGSEDVAVDPGSEPEEDAWELGTYHMVDRLGRRC